MISLEAFSELLEVLYSAPLHESQWKRFLDVLALHTQSRMCFFLRGDTRLGVSILAQGGREDTTITASYNLKYAPVDPFRAPALADPRPRVVRGDDLVPPEALFRSELYQGVLAPAHLRHATLILLHASTQRIECISLWRGPDQGPVSADVLATLELLLPHLQKALDLRQILAVSQQRLSGAQTMLDASPTPTLLLSRHGRVLHMNAAADTLLLREDGLALRHGALYATQIHRQQPLVALLRQAASSMTAGEDDSAAYRLTLERSAEQSPLHLLALPLQAPERQSTSADLLLFISDPDRPLRFSSEDLRSLFQLTRAETEVVNGLLLGLTLQEIASIRRVAVSTVRLQLKSIFAKTGTTRQSVLLQRLTTLPNPRGNPC